MMQICRSEGVAGLWSGYGSTFSALLPYTIIYFATYEQLKQIARWIEHSKGNSRPWDYAPALRDYCSHFGQPNSKVSKTQLTLDTYMMCVASAAVISSTVCQTATVLSNTLRGHLGLTQKSSTDHLRSVKRPVSLETVRMSPLLSPEISALSPLPSTRHFPYALSVVNFVGSSSFKSHPFVPPQFRAMTSRASTVAGQALISLPWQQCQHATLTTTSLLPIRNTMGLHGLKGHVGLTIPWHPSIVSQANVLILPAFSATTTALQRTPGSVMMIVPTPLAGAVLSSNDNEKTRVANNVALSKTSQATGIFRTIARGLGPRILWTVPGVTMTTAGFEVLRSIAQGAQ
ncbi:hypothetical protein BG011_008177 [Mortierella polycephala]|uniref:Mitochondrial carrier n=1 Tax=Mortierella polycephala TaxID=41804 RepID=A0A9P6Q9Y9_9FUNG|nr:hypothetical protein BG011_008177 [Mortierella polycephala]